MQDAVASGKLSQANMDRVVEKATNDIRKINELFSNIDLNTIYTGNGGSSSSSTSSTEKEYEELFDFFERRIDVLNNSLDLLKTNLENVTGSFAKNNLLSAQSSIYQEEINNYTDALAMYQQKADEVLSTLPDDIAAKIKNGAIDLTTFVGESSEAVVEAIKDYQGWADKIADCNKQLAELQQTLRSLELDKFNNIIEDFTKQFDLRSDSIDFIDKQIALFEEAGQLIGESFYVTQKDQAQKQLALLNEQKTAMINQFNTSLSSGLIKKGTEEWYEMVKSLQEVDSSILDCKKSIEEFDNAILDLNLQVFERIQNTFSNLDSELGNIVGLLDDIDVADDTTGAWTTDAITKLGLLAQQFELSQYQVDKYNEAIAELNQQYSNGKYSAIEYSDKLAELSQQQWEAVNASESIKDAIIDLNQIRVDEIVDGIEKEIQSYKDLTDAQIEALDASRDLHEYEKSISEKTKSITDLERQIAAMQNDNTASTIAKRKKLEEELVKAKSDIEETQYQHSIDSQKDALNKQYEDYEKLRNDEIEALQNSLKNQEEVISQSFEVVKENASLVGNNIEKIAQEHGIQISDSLTSSWKSGEDAIASYGETLSTNTSAFIRNVVNVENNVLDLQNKANVTSESLATMFGTKADNLVNELVQSSYAEENLSNMTDILQQTLINTLERGYNVDSIISALKSIEVASNNAANAIGNLIEEKIRLNNNKIKEPKYRLIDNMTGRVYKDNLTYDEAVSLQANDKQVARHTTIESYIEEYDPNKLRKYASGTRSTKGNIFIKDEKGRELTLPKLSNGKYAIEPEGSQILTKVQTDNIFDWSKLKPIDVLPNLNIMGNIPKIANKNAVLSPSISYGSLVTINGDVNDTNHFTRQITQVVGKELDRSFKEFSDSIKY